MGVSFQLTILKVLVGHPEGRASVADLKEYVTVLSCSGVDWTERMKRLHPSRLAALFPVMKWLRRRAVGCIKT